MMACTQLTWSQSVKVFLSETSDIPSWPSIHKGTQLDPRANSAGDNVQAVETTHPTQTIERMGAAQFCFRSGTQIL
jgi:hypothetical protein